MHQSLELFSQSNFLTSSRFSLNKEGTFNDTFPLGILNLSHPRWEKVVGYLSSHLWNYREPEIFGNETDPGIFLPT